MSEKKRPRGRPFKKGQSGNPKGRPPKECTIRGALEYFRDAKEIDITVTDAMGVRRPIHVKSSVPFKFALAGTVWMRCLNGDIDFVKYLTEHTEGKPLQRIETDTLPASAGVDLSKLSDEELDRLDSILGKAVIPTSK